jgi:hypothetical protein
LRAQIRLRSNDRKPVDRARLSSFIYWLRTRDSHMDLIESATSLIG